MVRPCLITNSSLFSTFFHLTSIESGPKGEHAYDPWVKIRFLLDFLNAAFQNYFVDHQNVYIGESLIGMKSRCAFIQYLPKKKHKQYGMKNFESHDSETSRVLHIELYSGFDHLADSPLEGKLVEKVIMDVMCKSNLLNKGYHLFTDNFYTKIPLAKDLLQQNTYITGTLNKNSEYISETAVKSKLGERESVYFRHQDKLLVAYKQKVTRKPVFF